MVRKQIIEDGYTICSLLARAKTEKRRIHGVQGIADALGWSIGRTEKAMWGIRRKLCPPYWIPYGVPGSISEFEVVDVGSPVMNRDHSEGISAWLEMICKEAGGQLDTVKLMLAVETDPAERIILEEDVETLTLTYLAAKTAAARREVR